LTWTDLGPWVLASMVLAVVAVALFVIFRQRKPLPAEDGYTQGLELWLAGDLPAARQKFREAIDRDPSVIHPYLQLGNLLRITGEPARAAVLHRGLTVRKDVPPGMRIPITLALAADLNAAERWTEARLVLDSLKSQAFHLPHFWNARCDQWLGSGEKDKAALALRTAAQNCSEPEAQEFQRRFEFFQTDRALQHCRAGELPEARRLLKDVSRQGPATAQITFVQVLLAASEGNPDRALTLAAAGLVDYPQEMAIFFPALQEILLESGHYERTVPILERACQTDTAPPALWITLALLYEKLGRREDGLTLLAAKTPDSRLTPSVAAPYLKTLIASNPDAAFTRAWNSLHFPTATSHWLCSACGSQQPEVRWFCPACHTVNSYAPIRQ